MLFDHQQHVPGTFAMRPPAPAETAKVGIFAQNAGGRKPG